MYVLRSRQSAPRLWLHSPGFDPLDPVPVRVTVPVPVTGTLLGTDAGVGAGYRYLQSAGDGAGYTH